MTLRLYPGPMSPLSRAVAGVAGGALVVGALYVFAAVLAPTLIGRSALTLWSSLAAIVGGVGCLGVARTLVRAARTGVSPESPTRWLKP